MPYEKQSFVDGEVLTAAQLNHMEQGIYDANEGAAQGDGSYYMPVVTQPTDNTMMVSYSPSNNDMESVEPVVVTLPEGETGPEGYTPQRGVDYWTAEDVAQIVSQTRSQVDAAAKYELIETITLAEADSEIVVKNEPDGTPYNFKVLLANIYVPAGATFSAYVYGFGAIKDIAISYIPGAGNATGDRYSRVCLDVTRGWTDGYVIAGTATKNSNETKTSAPLGFFRALSSLSMLGLWASSGSFPVGTKIDIYGVRA